MPDFRAVFPEDAMKNCVFKAIILKGNADLVVFDNTGTDLNAHNVNDAIVELNDKIGHATDDYYTKEETDAKLELKADASELENYYTKSESDSLLAEKADASSVYTKSETDDLLALKADADSVYTKQEADGLLDLKADESELANYYTKTESDNLLDAKADSNFVYTKQETNDLLSAKVDSTTLATDYYDKSDVNSLLSAKANADAVYTKEETDAEISALIDDAHVANNKAWSSEKISKELYDILPTEEASGAIANFNTSLALPLVSVKSAIVATQEAGTPTPQSPKAISGVSELSFKHSGSDMTDYDEYIINLGGTYYGGYVEQDKDGKRELVVTHTAKVKLSDLGYWNYSASANRFFVTNISDVFQKADWNTHIGLCECYTEGRVANNQGDDLAFAFYNATLYIRDNNYSNVQTWLEAVGDYYITYLLDMPFTVALPDGEPITAFNGVNNVWNDTGNTTAEYKLSIEEYVAKKIAEITDGNRSLNTSLLRGSGDEREDITLPSSDELERETIVEPERDDSQR